jgi:hypothetical protein
VATCGQKVGEGRGVVLKNDPVPVLPNMPTTEDDEGGRGGRQSAGRRGGSILVEVANIGDRREAAANRVPEGHRKRASEDDVRSALIRAPTDFWHTACDAVRMCFLRSVDLVWILEWTSNQAKNFPRDGAKPSQTKEVKGAETPPRRESL